MIAAATLSLDGGGRDEGVTVSVFLDDAAGSRGRQSRPRLFMVFEQPQSGSVCESRRFMATVIVRPALFGAYG